MRTIIITVVAFITLLLSSCSVDYYYSYTNDKNNKGKAIFIPTNSCPRTFVILNDSIILKDKSVKSLTLENLPDGEYKLSFLSSFPGFENNLEKSYKFNITNGSQSDFLVPTPVYSKGYWTYSGLSGLSVSILYVGILSMNTY